MIGTLFFQTINTVSEVIRGSQVNQDYFASVNAPSNPPRWDQWTKTVIRRLLSDRKLNDLSDLSSFFVHRPAIVVLLMSMVNERQPFVLRCAVLYCFQCFLYKNQKGQGEIVATLLPSTIDGQLHQVENLKVALTVVLLSFGLIIVIVCFSCANNSPGSSKN